MKRILVMEDDRQLAAYWQAGLEARGFAVAHVSDVDAAIAALNGERFDLVISDMLIRDVEERVEPKGGFSLLTHISLNMRDRPKVIAVSGALPALNLMKHAKILKADRALEKPITVEELVQVVEQTLIEGDDSPK